MSAPINPRVIPLCQVDLYRLYRLYYYVGYMVHNKSVLEKPVLLVCEQKECGESDTYI